MAGRNAPDWLNRSTKSPETIDRALLGLCAVIWLLLLGMGVAATVALIDLGRGFHQPTGGQHTGLLYIIIGVSALIILAAIPMLLRARQVGPRQPVSLAPQRSRRAPAAETSAAHPERPAGHAAFDPRATGRRSAPRKLGVDRSAVDRVLLRGSTELASVLGTSLTAVALSTYLMAVGKDTASWVVYGVAGLIAAAMPVVPWLHLRQLREVAGHRV